MVAPAWPRGQMVWLTHARGATGARPWHGHHTLGRRGGSVACGATLAGALFGLRDGNWLGEGVALGNRRGGEAHRGGAASVRRRRWASAATFLGEGQQTVAGDKGNGAL
jgi:hypothetical protein